MLKYLTILPEKLSMCLDIIRTKSSNIILIISIILVQFLFLGTYETFVKAEIADGNIDVIGMFGNNNGMSYAASGDDKANNLSLKMTNDASSVTTGLLHLYGTDSVVGGRKRSDEIGLTDPIARNGLISTVEAENVAFLIDSVSIDIPQHFANQWLPGSASKEFSVYAQGGGYNFLKNDVGLEPIWQMFRDIAYAGFVIVLIAAGFMIMLRSKIGGQVTVGVMNTIPGVIMGLVLVTFSFSIVGFILDLARLASFLIIKIMELNLMSSASSSFSIVRLPDSPLLLMAYAFQAVPIARGATSPLVGMASPVIAGLILTNPLFGVATVVAGLIVLIIGVAVFYACIKISIMLITTYVKIIIDLVFGPVYILMGSLPGKSSTIMEWLKRLIANALVFPATVFILNLIRYIGYSSVDTSTPTSFMSGGNFSGEGFIGSLLSARNVVVIAGLFMISSVPDVIQEALQAATPKSLVGAQEKAQKAAGKIPLVGGLFG